MCLVALLQYETHIYASLAFCSPLLAACRQHWISIPSPALPIYTRNAFHVRTRQHVMHAAFQEAGKGANLQNKPFDWRVALVLAGCAFEAYNGLDESEAQCIRQRSVGGTEVAFADAHFLKAKLAGLVEITVVSAAGLRDADWMPFAKSDPYCQISIGPSCARTKTVANNLDPVWNETFFLFVRDLRTQRLQVRVLDEDLIESDDLLGAGMRGLADLAEGREIEVEVPLSGGNGTVTIRLQFLPFDDVTTMAEMASSGRMGGPVLGSPANALFSSPWRSLIQELLVPAEAAANALFDPLCFVDNPKSDTQAWLFWNREKRLLCVAFRGTEMTKIQDILTDMSLVPSALDVEGEGGLGIEDAATATGGELDNFRNTFWGQAANVRALFSRRDTHVEDEAKMPEWVHAGFLQAWKSIRAEICDLVDTALKGESESWTLFVTGHSLGGALSTLCAYDLARRPASAWPGGYIPEIVNYSFGAPRVGNSAFARRFNQVLPNAWRVVNNGDLVTSVPRLMGYAHVGHKITISPDGVVEMEYDTSTQSGEGITSTELAAAMVAAALKTKVDGDGRDIEIRDLIEAEKEALARILDGSAVAEHLEDLYLANMGKAMQSYIKNENKEIKK
jgi:hypothetical protein